MKLLALDLRARLRHRCFPVKYAKFLRSPTLKNICEQSKRLPLNFIKKETQTQVISCEFCEFFKNTYFVENLRTAGSETPVRRFLFKKVASLTA